MTTYEDDFEDEVEETPAPLDPNIRKQLREAEKLRKEAAALKAELEQNKREVQFTKAGIPETGLGKLFRDAYNGEADADAIRKSAEEYGILQAPASFDGASDAELDALRRTQGATVGSSGATPDAEQEYIAALADAKTPEDVMALVQSQTGQKLGLWTSRSAY